MILFCFFWVFNRQNWQAGSSNERDGDDDGDGNQDKGGSGIGNMTTAKGKTKYLGKKVLNSTQNEVLITALLLEQTSVNGPSQEEVIFIYLFIDVNNFFRILCAFLLLPCAENFKFFIWAASGSSSELRLFRPIGAIHTNMRVRVFSQCL